MTSVSRIRTHNARVAPTVEDATAVRRGRINSALVVGAAMLVAVYAVSGSMLAATTWRLTDSQARLAVARLAHDGIVADIASLDDRESLTALAGQLGMNAVVASYIVEPAAVAAAR